MRHVIDAIAAQGRGKDKELLHVTKGEIAGLDALARRHFGRELPRNPRTGLKEASLFQDWFGSDVGMALDVAAPVAVGFIPGVGIPAAAAMGAGLGAANQGLGKGGTTESALLGGVAGGIGAYGGANMASGLGTAAAPTGVTPGVTPIGEAGAGLGTAATEVGATSTAPTISEAGANLSQMSGQGQAQAQAAMQASPNLSQNTLQATGSNMPGATAAPAPDAGLNWNYLTTKDALSPATQMATSASMTAGIPGVPSTTDTTGTTTDKSLPKSEVYYTPYGERRTRIAAAEGGLMGLNGSYGDYDGAEDGVGDRRYAGGGGIDIVRQMQPGGAWGNLTADAYGVMHENMPGFINDATPGGFLGATTPGKADYLDKKAAEEQKKKSEQEAGIAAALKARQDQESSDYWKQRYGMAEGGIANISAAKGRYLQGPGDGMSDSIPARIDGKQEARLATNEFVVPADVVSHIGNGSSDAGAKELHAMMDRIRQARTGTKKQGKQVNPRKYLPA